MQDHISKNKPFLWTQFHLEMHSISNFPLSFDHFEGGMEDFLNQERKRILHTPKRRGVENPFTFLIEKIFHATLKVIKRWWKIANGMHFQMKLCP